RVDELPAAEVEDLARRIAADYPGVPVLRLSAKTGAGFDALPVLLDQDGAFGQKILAIDYDTYAEGEAELGWLNCTAAVRPSRPIDLDDLLMDVIVRLRIALAGHGAEVAHLKVIGLSGDGFGVAN